MDKERIMEILSVQERAFTDEQYLQLHEDYSCAQDKLRQLMQNMGTGDRKVLEDYLLAAAPLHHRLMELAIDYGKQFGR